MINAPAIALPPQVELDDRERELVRWLALLQSIWQRHSLGDFTPTDLVGGAIAQLHTAATLYARRGEPEMSDPCQAARDELLQTYLAAKQRSEID